MEEDDLYPPLESLSEDFTHFEIIWVMITENRMEEEDLYPPLESLSEDFTHFEIIGMGKFGQVYRVTSNKTGNVSHIVFERYFFVMFC